MLSQYAMLEACTYIGIHIYTHTDVLCNTHLEIQLNQLLLEVPELYRSFFSLSKVIVSEVLTPKKAQGALELNVHRGTLNLA